MNKIEEAKFQEVFEIVNKIDCVIFGKHYLIFNKKDLRFIFWMGMEFGKEIIRQDFGTYLQEIDKRYIDE